MDAGGEGMNQEAGRVLVLLIPAGPIRRPGMGAGRCPLHRTHRVGSIPSRVQAQLDEIEFVGENQVRAYAMIKNTRALFYLLVRENDKWKIGVR